jgi:hypothetical protein
MRLADATTSHYMEGDVIHTALEHPSLMAFSTNIFIYILYCNIFSTLLFKLNIVYLSVVLFCVIHPSKNTSMNMAIIGG